MLPARPASGDCLARSATLALLAPAAFALRVITDFVGAVRLLRVTAAFFPAAPALRVFAAFFAADFLEAGVDAAMIPLPADAANSTPFQRWRPAYMIVPAPTR